MQLADVLDEIRTVEFPAVHERAHPQRDTVLAARKTIESAVVDDEFIADCIELELQLIARTQFRRGLVPFLVVPGLGIRFAFGYWPPGGTPGPHEHTAWTITAVCRNELEVQTYDRDESHQRRALVPKNRFNAGAGRVGYIYQPSIHAPINTSADWSLSMHISSPRDGEPMEDCQPVEGLVTPRRRRPPQDAHPYATAMAARAATERIHVLARALAGMTVDRASTLLVQCAELGSHSTRKLATRNRGDTRAFDTSTPYLLRRTHPDLMLSHRVVDDTAALMVETAGETIEELAIDVVASDAIAYAAKEAMFDIRELPGNITDEERILIAEALEDSGLFTWVAS